MGQVAAALGAVMIPLWNLHPLVSGLGVVVMALGMYIRGHQEPAGSVPAEMNSLPLTTRAVPRQPDDGEFPGRETASGPK